MGPEGLGQVVKRSFLGCLDSGINGAVTGDNDHLRVPVGGFDMGENFQAGHIGQLQIEKNDVKGILLHFG